MISLNSTGQDLIDDVNNFDIMVTIESPRETFYISTREQYFKVSIDSPDVFFEDLGIKIGSIKESMNYKTKKVKLSSTSITINNYLINDLRFTDSDNVICGLRAKGKARKDYSGFVLEV